MRRGRCDPSLMGSLDGQRAVVMGLGRFGGGAGAVRFLADEGADVLVTDLADEVALTEGLERIADLVRTGAVTLRLGEHNVSDFTDADLVVANPAVKQPWANRFIRAAQAAGATVTTEIGLLLHRLPSRERTIGVTGTAGKSTVSSMIAHVLRAGGLTAWLGGNIGGSLLDRIGEIKAEDWVVLELSSAQLHWVQGWSPHVAVVTNVAENHLDWHGSMMHYEASKREILKCQRAGDGALLGPGASGWAPAQGVVRIDEAQGDVSLSLPGAHNEANARQALGACALGRRGWARLDHDVQGPAASAWSWSAKGRGVRFFNDSKCTTPEAAALAVDAFQSGRPPDRRRV